MTHKEKALVYFGNKFHCSQSVLAAFADEVGLSEEQALKLGACFGGGMRQGAVAVYLDAWHKDLPEFLQLRTNNGDDRMKALAQEFPQYGWDKNMGYPSAAHREAIAQYGTTPHHRLSFRLLPERQLSLF